MASPEVRPRGSRPENTTHTTGPSATNSRHKFSLCRLWRQIKSSPWQLIHLLHRLAIFGCAFYYAMTSIRASVAMMEVLSGVQQFELPLTTYIFSLITQNMGSGSVRMSPLVQQVLANNTNPRTDTIYLEANGSTFDACHTPKFNRDQYGNAYLRKVYGLIVEGTKHAYPDLAALELIAPVVDCSFSLIQRGERTRGRLFLLLRSKTDTDNVFLASWRLSIADYEIEARNERGPSLVIGLVIFNDTRATNLTNLYAGSLGYPYSTLAFEPYHYVEITSAGKRVFKTIPANPKTQAVKTILSARRTGVYANTESDRSNVKNVQWRRESAAMNEISRWISIGGSTVRNSLAFGHAIHIFFAIDLLFKLMLLLLLMCRGLSKGKLWVGDAFVSISSTLFLRGVLILLSWYLERFWTLTEFYLAISNEFYGLQHIQTYPELMHADLMNLYLCLLTAIGYVFRERIDPALALMVFEVSWRHRFAITHWYPKIVSDMMTEAKTDYNLGLMSMPALKAKTAPLRFWTAHEISSSMTPVASSSIAPVLQIVALHVVYVLIRKVYRRWYPEKLKKLVNSRVTELSQGSQAREAQAHILTIFEIATGAPLQNSMGVVADYDTCRFIKGLKYACPDGIYSSGFVIASQRPIPSGHERSLVHSGHEDHALALPQCVHVRSDCFTVKRTARLLYPEMISWTDLFNLELTVLS